MEPLNTNEETYTQGTEPTLTFTAPVTTPAESPVLATETDVPAEPVQEPAPEVAPEPPKRKRGRPRKNPEDKKVAHRGQTGDPLDKGFTEMNSSEKRIMQLLDPDLKGRRAELTISELVDATGWGKRGKAKANSRVRNNLRRPVRAGLIEHADALRDGTYLVTEKGRKQMRRAAEVEAAKPKKAKVVVTEVPVAETAPVETAVVTEDVLGPMPEIIVLAF